MDDYRQQSLALLNRVAARLKAIYAKAARQAALIGASIHRPKTGKTFSLYQYPQVKAKVDALIAELHAQTQAVVVDGIREAWNLAERKNAELVRAYLGGDLTDAQVEKYFGGTSEALEAFLARKAGGLGLSDRVWNYSSRYRDEIEAALGVGISNGDPAAKMARDMKAYLKYPDRLFRRVRDNNGVLRLSSPARLFHPGQGVYRSSLANARRLAVNEVNMAYHTADYNRWQSLDFVVGIKVTPSGAHPCPDICDQLAGFYPKDFKFTGWHPQCMCHATSVLKTKEEMTEDTRRILAGKQTVNWSRRSVTSVPDGFAAWVRANEGKIHASKSRPYFVNDNIGFVRGVLLGGDTGVYAEEDDFKPLAKDEFDSRVKYLDMAVKNNFLPMSAVDEIKRIQEMGDETAAQIRAKLNALDMKAYHNAENPNPDIAKMNAVQGEIKKQPIKDIGDVDRIMGQYYDQYPQEFNNHRVPFTTYNEPREKDGPYIAGKSSHNKFIAFNEADDKGSGSWFDTIRQAFNAVRDNQPMTGGSLMPCVQYSMKCFTKQRKDGRNCQKRARAINVLPWS